MNVYDFLLAWFFFFALFTDMICFYSGFFCLISVLMDAY